MFAKKAKAATENGTGSGFIKRLRARINRGESWLTYDLANLAPGGKIDAASLEELESLLVMADVGIDTTERIIADVGQLNKVSLMRSDVGRRPGASAISSTRLLQIPATIRSRPRDLFSPLSD